jgi:hypothetical protein
MTAAAFEARLCPTWLNEIKKTKLYTNTSPAAGINFLLATVGFRTLIVSCSLIFCQPLIQCPTSCRLSTKPNSIIIESMSLSFLSPPFLNFNPTCQRAEIISPCCELSADTKLVFKSFVLKSFLHRLRRCSVSPCCQNTQ